MVYKSLVSSWKILVMFHSAMHVFLLPLEIRIRGVLWDLFSCPALRGFPSRMSVYVVD